MSPRFEKHALDADKGVALLVVFICLPFCVVAGVVAWMAGQMRDRRHWSNWSKRNQPDSDLERGVLAVIILMALVLFAIGIGTLAEMMDAASLP